jgi:N-acetylglucosaminyl-diphospho-decaprenol L-rhamnosyltransferase
MISAIIVSFNTAALLRQCLADLYANSADVEMEVFVVDNNSKDDSVVMVKTEFPEVKLIANKENLGFAAANNQAWQRSSGEYILLLNPDAFVKQGAVANAVTFLESHPECGICGGRLVKPDGSLDPSARKFPTFLNKLFVISGLSSRFPESRLFSGHEFGNFDHNSVMEVDWVPGTFTMYRREMLEHTGLFDERFYIYYEETDLCQTAKNQDWKVYFLPSAEIVHVGGASSKTRKDHAFDTGALQVVRFRMRSEWLYFRKNSGLAAVLANAGAELGWHVLRWLANLIPGRPDKSQKQKASALIIREIITSLKETRCGSYAPSVPW